LLLEFGADINQVGWIEVGGNWFFGSPLELAYQISSTMEQHYMTTAARIINELSMVQEKLCKQKTASGNKIVEIHLHHFSSFYSDSPKNLFVTYYLNNTFFYRDILRSTKKDQRY